ncbi:MAG: insulinase family protein [Thermoanaerobaculia bacterium]|nr:insulinase family protein [Thermoanaerobaculia bacterium]
MTVRLRRCEGAPVVAVRLLLAGGARCEAIPGQALLTGRLLTEGTRRRSWEQIAADAEGRGMILSSFGGYETHGLSIDALAGDWQLALEWVAELAFESVFPQERLSWLARQAAAELEAQADQADLMTARTFAEQVYAPHPRGRPLQGDAASLARLDPELCHSFHAAAQGWGAFLSIAGEIDEGTVGKRAGELFGELLARANVGAGSGERPVPPRPSVAPPPRREIVTRAQDQAHLFLGSRTVARAHPDYPALELAAVLLGTGSGLTGRIPQRIREREGLAYTATADTVSGAGLDEGRLVCYVGTAPETLDQAEASVRDELQRFLVEPIAAEELESARSYLLGREPFRRETARQWADLMAVSALLDLPLDDPEWYSDQVRRLTADDVVAASRRWIDPERLLVTRGLPTSRGSARPT